MLDAQCQSNASGNGVFNHPLPPQWLDVQRAFLTDERPVFGKPGIDRNTAGTNPVCQDSFQSFAPQVRHRDVLGIPARADAGFPPSVQ